MVALQDSFSYFSVLNGQEYFRIKQELESGGDIFEIDSSVKALVIGPESDVSDLLVTFYDQQSNLKIGETIISAATPFIGRVDSFLSTVFPGTGLPARIQVSVRDIIDNTTVPQQIVTPEVISRPKPLIDLLAYFDIPASLPLGRADKSYLYPFGTVTNLAGPNLYIVPMYGRRYASVMFQNWGVPSYNITVYKVMNSIGAVGLPTSGTVGGSKALCEQMDTALVAGNASYSETFTYCDEGLYDLLIVDLALVGGVFVNAFNNTLRITVSDQ